MNRFSRRSIPYSNAVRVNFYSKESDPVEGVSPVYSVMIDKYSPWFVYFCLEDFVRRYYLHGLTPFWTLPAGAFPCTNIRRLHDMDYFDFIY